MEPHRRQWLPVNGIAVLTVVVVIAAARGQSLLHSAASTFRADSSLVVVPITVLDKRGAIVSGLSSNSFTLIEDGVKQQIRSFTREDAPVSMGIVLDLSESMRPLLGNAREALRSLLRDSNSGDEAFLNAVSSRPRGSSGFTLDFGEILSRVVLEDAGGNTALVDTISDSLRELRSGVHARKALLVISDGMDNHSRHSKEELLQQALEADAQIYTVAVGPGTPGFAKAMELAEEKQGVLFLENLAVETGGLSFAVHNARDIATAACRISQAMRNQYIVGYVPGSHSPTNQWHQIRVKVAGSGMKAYARTGYRL